LSHAASLLAAHGSLHLVDFGDQAGLPNWFRAMLFRWLDWFHVTPRLDLQQELEALAKAAGLQLQFRDLYRGYAFFAKLQRGAK
jgi:S-adenosylmethionine-diacylgycerolhomoserine-N-methlytransferase